MAMKELLRVTLDEGKIRQACEEYVSTQARIQPDEEAKASWQSKDGKTLFLVEVIVRKRRARKAKG